MLAEAIQPGQQTLTEKTMTTSHNNQIHCTMCDNEVASPDVVHCSLGCIIAADIMVTAEHGPFEGPENPENILHAIKTLFLELSSDNIVIVADALKDLASNEYGDNDEAEKRGNSAIQKLMDELRNS